MIRRLFDPYFTGYVLLWVLVHYLRSIGLILPLINSYLTDLLAVPSIAHLTITIIRCYVVNDDTYNYPFGYVLIIIVYLSFVFECLMPVFSPVYTRDWGDMAAYCCGGFFYYFIHGKRQNRKTEKG